MSRRILAGLVLSGVVVLPAAPALAATGAVVSPAPGTTVETATVVEIRAEVAGPVESEVTLRLTPPGGAARTVASVPPGAGGTATFALDVGCTEPTPRCVDERPAVNGTWTAALEGADAEPRTFVLRVPPTAPREVVAIRRAAAVVVEWRRGPEPDLVAYDLRAADGASLLTGFPVGEACRETVCRAEVETDGATVSVRAQRATCPGCAETLRSDDAPAPVTSPSAEPTPGEAASGSAEPEPSESATPSASATPVAVAGVLPGLSLASPGVSPSPFDGAPLVAAPPLPLVAGAAIVGAEDGSVVAEPPRLLPGASVADRRARFAAGALLMVLAAAHLRRWAGAGRPVSAGAARAPS